MQTMPALPIDNILDDIRLSLRDAPRLVLAAPPGAGKTTRVPLALLEEDWAKSGKILVLEPRRIAARAAAARMAQTLGQTLGQDVGLRARMDVRTSEKARIEVVTEGVFTRMVLDDPELSGVSAVLFDEFHERSMDADFGLALALECQDVFRPDLRLMAMSATLDTDRLAGYLNAPVLVSEGRAFPVTTHYLERDKTKRLEDDVARAVRQALRDETGSILVFLPGMAEIRRTAEQLSSLPENTTVTQLYGALSPKEQDAAIKPAPESVRKIVLATDIAESSLTIEGVRIVIDAGLARVPRYDPQLGAARLETIRASLANIDQRRGRAGRTEPGVCYRLWREAETRGLAAFPTPEIANADLTGLIIDMARWGAFARDGVRFLDLPPEGVWRASVSLLKTVGALDETGRLTNLGEQLTRLPLPPRLAVMVLKAADHNQTDLACQIAALLGERGAGGRSLDLQERLRNLMRDDSPRHKSMRKMANNWSRLAGGTNSESANREEAGDVIARGFPDRIARARPGKPGEYQLANGRAAMMDPHDPLASHQWLAIADVTGGGPNLRITAAAPIAEADALEIGGVRTEDKADFDPNLKRLTARKIIHLGAIVLSQTPLPKPSGEAALKGLLAAVRKHGFKVTPIAEALSTLIQRVRFLRAHDESHGWPSDFESVLLDRLEDWLAPLLNGAKDFASLSAGKTIASAKNLMDWDLVQALDQLAPETWECPVGRKIVIDYDQDGGPAVSLKVQEVYGLTIHPKVLNGRIPLSLVLLSPAKRPVAQTKDISSFWTGGYPDMRKDMRGRYPKHDWPEDPASASPHSHAKRRT